MVSCAKTWHDRIPVATMLKIIRIVFILFVMNQNNGSNLNKQDALLKCKRSPGPFKLWAFLFFVISVFSLKKRID